MLQAQNVLMICPYIYIQVELFLKPRSQMPLRTATEALRTIFRQWKFRKTMEKKGDLYEIIVRTTFVTVALYMPRCIYKSVINKMKRSVSYVHVID